MQHKETNLCCFTSQNFHGLHRFPLISHHFSLFIPTEQGARRHHCPASRCGAQPAGTGIDGGHGADSDALRGAENWRPGSGGFTVEISSVTSWGCIDYTWVNYNDLTATSLESWLVRGIIPKWPYFRSVKNF